QAHGHSLTGINASYSGWNNAFDRFQQNLLVLGLKFGLKFRQAVKVIFYGTLMPTRYENQLGNPGSYGLFDGILHQGLVNTGQQRYEHGFCGGQIARAQTGHRKNCLTYWLHYSITRKRVLARAPFSMMPSTDAARWIRSRDRRGRVRHP